MHAKIKRKSAECEALCEGEKARQSKLSLKQKATAQAQKQTRGKPEERGGWVFLFLSSLQLYPNFLIVGVFFRMSEEKGSLEK